MEYKSIIDLVNEWLPTGIFRNVDTPFSTDSTHDKKLDRIQDSLWNNSSV